MNYQQFQALCDSTTQGQLTLLDRRFNSLLISLSFARKLNANSVALEAEEVVSQRALLEVERRRQDERDRALASQRYQQKAASAELHERIFNLIRDSIAQPEQLRARVLDISDDAINLIDNLYTRAVSIRKLEEYTPNLPWLEEDLIRAVNLPPFADSKDTKRVKVTSVRNAMGFIGSEDLGILVPAYTMQYLLPNSIEPFNLLSQKIWEHALGTANTAQVLAELDGDMNPSMAFIMGMFHGLGKGALARLYTQCFDDIKRNLLQELRQAGRSVSYNALLQLGPSELYLRNFMLHFSHQYTAKLFASMNFRFIPFQAVYEDFAKAKNVNELNGLARNLYQAQRYSQFRMMYSANFATAEDGKTLCKDAGLQLPALDVLRGVNLKRLRLRRGAAADPNR
ncbi:HDOD domain-containing protein [Aliidiomarina quisquiliarum]|uniref:HDOD domain-containing protein n=1 Tax=Aliidiomarina quisquiliarum TaxID=2938947 RepID=UPI00208FC430|nr:HDOD domain-containing protein [Aliidiomarina quisquiliarum]MCO4321141.1 HDOD domain-containing protein [Aliidiomarina quisquiliarum]